MKCSLKKKYVRLLTVNLALMAAVFVGNYFFLTVGGLAVKAVTGAGFVGMGLVNLFCVLVEKSRRAGFHATLAAGLVLAFAGDVLIVFDFVAGAALFAAGHICFFVSFWVLDRPRLLDLAVSGGICLAGACFLLFAPILRFSQGYIRAVCLVYALILSLMVGKAIGNFARRRSPITAVILVGSILFFFSDLMLVFDWFSNAGRMAGLLCMGTYYPAECLLAFSGTLALLEAEKP